MNVEETITIKFDEFCRLFKADLELKSLLRYLKDCSKLSADEEELEFNVKANAIKALHPVTYMEQFMFLKTKMEDERFEKI